MVERYDNFIAGQWHKRGAQGGQRDTNYISNINPSNTNDIIGLYAQADSQDLNLAIEAAKDAQIVWQGMPLEQKQAILDKIGCELIERCDELGKLLSREEGKTFLEGRGEVYRAGQFFTYYAAEILRQFGENTASVRPDIDIVIEREALGCVGIISPWNFPLATACWKIAPALAYGNSVIWKPANETPASAWALAEIISRSDLPQGSFQLLMGAGRDIGAALVAHPDIDGVSFTGSRTVGEQIAHEAMANLTKIQLEMGSKNALLVMDDAHLDKAVEAAFIGGYSGTGQKCTASSRLLLHEKIHDEFIEKFITLLKTKPVGHALDPQTQIGPVINETQLASHLSFIDEAVREGAKLEFGGEQIKLAHPGHYLSPALLTDSNNGMNFNQQELFGPIIGVQKVSNYEEGLAIVNDTPYGLVAGLFTSSQSLSKDFRRKAQTGCVMVNLPTAGTDYHVPFGGRKKSSYGSREQGTYAREFYTQVKTSYIHS